MAASPFLASADYTTHEIVEKPLADRL